MQPSNLDPLSQTRDGLRADAQQSGSVSAALARSAAENRRARADDSWVEISSQPSSSSLSSVADEIVTTGLRVRHDSNARRRRRDRPVTPSSVNRRVRPSSAGSSQEEYEESESESDRVMTSSNEDIQINLAPRNVNPSAAPPSLSVAEDVSDDDDEDESSTAVGVQSSDPVFTPQPNAFSHPPSASASRENPMELSYFSASRPATRPPTHRSSSESQRRRQHTPYNMISPSHQADHDAALRASLSTLLSCAAAARGLPKRNQAGLGVPSTSPRVEAGALRIVPESVVMGEESELRGTPATSKADRTSSASPSRTDSSSRTPVHEKGKRKASTSKDRRAINKTRHGSADVFSPTLITWVVSAGFVVIVSAITFSAGYAMGKEAGRAEIGVFGNADESTSCGREAMKGSLRRFRWSSGGSSSIRV
ncbi:MAG: hypothetical protein M1819_004937 [Sarea resinae]|nr:MAG: hypothetical protein M1819_004937 [Sarea resinae]